jgi:hypothetical protein
MSVRAARLSFVLATAAAFCVLWVAIAAHPWTGPTRRPVDPRVTALAARERRLQHEAVQVKQLLARRWAVYDSRLRLRTRQIALARATYRRQLAAARLREQQNAAALAARAASLRAASLASNTTTVAQSVPAAATPPAAPAASPAAAPAPVPAPAPAAPPKVVVVTVPAVTTSTSSKP